VRRFTGSESLRGEKRKPGRVSGPLLGGGGGEPPFERKKKMVVRKKGAIGPWGKKKGILAGEGKAPGERSCPSVAAGEKRKGLPKEKNALLLSVREKRITHPVGRKRES